mmetsp:Transcript_22755/g.67747  ORF Transcript_22755/g.67747 Transcript_22755/m.67747 type:complete len:285 (-) Transcript_22755:223-1077(-)
MDHGGRRRAHQLQRQAHRRAEERVARVLDADDARVHSADVHADTQVDLADGRWERDVVGGLQHLLCALQHVADVDRNGRGLGAAPPHVAGRRDVGVANHVDLVQHVLLDQAIKRRVDAVERDDAISSVAGRRVFAEVDELCHKHADLREALHHDARAALHGGHDMWGQHLAEQQYVALRRLLQLRHLAQEQSQLRLHAREHLLRLERLADVVARPCLQPLDDVLGRRLAGDHDDGRRDARRQTAHLSAHLVPAEVRQRHVEQHELHRRLRHHVALERLHARRGL